MSRNIALIVEYDGTRFAGFQRQSNAISIQGELESAIRALTGRESKIRGAGRTDAGVHATGQVVAPRRFVGFELRSSINGLILTL